MREVKITAVMNGFVVRVDCQTLVFQTRDDLIRDLDAYLRDPEATEKRFITQYGMRGGQDVAAPQTPDYGIQRAEAELTRPAVRDPRISTHAG